MGWCEKGCRRDTIYIHYWTAILTWNIPYVVIDSETEKKRNWSGLDMNIWGFPQPSNKVPTISRSPRSCNRRYAGLPSHAMLGLLKPANRIHRRSRRLSRRNATLWAKDLCKSPSALPLSVLLNHPHHSITLQQSFQSHEMPVAVHWIQVSLLVGKSVVAVPTILLGAGIQKFRNYAWDWVQK